MNPLGAWQAAGGVVAYGTDAPVTPLAGWRLVADAVRHTRPDQRVGVRAALAAASLGGHCAAGEEGVGRIAPGQRADLALSALDPAGLDADGRPGLGTGTPLPRCVGLLTAGRLVHADTDRLAAIPGRAE